MLCSHRRRSLEEGKRGPVNAAAGVWHAARPGAQHLTHSHPHHPEEPPQAICQAPRDEMGSVQGVGCDTAEMRPPRTPESTSAGSVVQRAVPAGCPPPQCSCVVQTDTGATTSSMLLAWTCPHSGTVASTVPGLPSSACRSSSAHSPSRTREPRTASGCWQ